MKPATAAVLRMIGYLVEIACLSMWLKIGSDEKIFFGLTVRNLLLGGVFSGMALIFASHILVKKTVPSKKPPRDFLR